MTWPNGAAVEGSRWFAGHLLIATPLLQDPNFYRSVVYVAEHDGSGAVGIVLNRPTDQSIGEHLPGWSDLMSEPPVVFIGGPVANDVAIGLGRDPVIEPISWQPTGPGIGLLDLAGRPEELIGIGDARAYSGYAGWIGGQLEAELRTGSWLSADALADDVFTDDPGGLWRSVLQRQEGTARLYASFPDDLRFN